MSSLSRIGVAIEEDLLASFDAHIHHLGYENRSEAFRDLIRAALKERAAAQSGQPAMGTLTLLYDHHASGLTGKLTQMQHDSESKILSTMHVHVTHHLCLEVIVLRGEVGELEQLAGKLGSLRGVQHAKLVIAAVGTL